MSDHEARAREICAPEYFSGVRSNDEQHIRDVAEALRTVRRETLEEAAKVASAWDLCRSVYDGNGNLCESTAGSRIAQAIRDLAVKEGEG